MFGRIKFLFFYSLVWVLIFELARVFFLFYQKAHTKGVPFFTLVQSLIHGIRMDISMAGYMLIPVCLFVLLSVSVPFFRRPLIYKIYSWTLLFFVTIIIVADLEGYKAWEFRMDATPLKYLDSPKEALASVSHLPLFWLTVLFLIIYGFFALLLSFFINRFIINLQSSNHKRINVFAILLFTIALIIPIRGGLQLAPMNQSAVYFSTNNFANQAAVNPCWNLLYGLVDETSQSRNPYLYLPFESTKKMVDSLYYSTGNTAQIVNTPNPNILFVIWESFTDKATRLLIDGKEVTPHFNQLKNEGIYFSHAYASGDRTDRGLPAVLSGYPALPQTSIIRTPSKSAKVSSLCQLLRPRGYSTVFYYGGETEFANIKSYLLQSGFDPIIDIHRFEKKDLNSKWGAHDGVVAQRILADLQKMKQPFFATWLTLSSHEPFETPVPVAIQGDDETHRFLNAIHYTDEVLYNFVEACKKQAWWAQTVMVIVADHGHPLPVTDNELDRFKIPILWLGGALKEKGVVVNRIVSQLDIAASVASQTGLSGSVFPFSKNSLDTAVKPWAFFSFNNGFGFVQPDGAFLFDNVGKRMTEHVGAVSPNSILAGKALQQYSFQDYLDK